MEIDELRTLVNSVANMAPSGREVDPGAIVRRDAGTVGSADGRRLESHVVELPPAGGRAELLLGRFTAYSGAEVHGKPTVVHIPAWVLLVRDVAFHAMRPGETSSQPRNPR